MKTSVTWLNDYLDPPLDAETQADVLTAAGFPWDGEGVAENGEPWQEIETTSNRGDCLCHVGLAREAAVIGGSRLLIPEAVPATGGADASTSIQVDNQTPDDCPIYTARVIRGVTVRESPDWLKRRIEAIGLVPRNNLVDATNFVLFELGQPTHVFDLDRLEGGRIEIRKARAGETMTPLGEGAESIELAPDDLVIADGGRPVALAGVKGGAETAVAEGTRDILLEAATFDPVAVRSASRRHRIASDSSYRFERGVHPADVAAAADRLAALILEVAGGELAPGVVADGRPVPRIRTVSLRPARCRRVLGIEIPDAEIERLLAGLDLEPRSEDDALVCTIPPRRLDLEREADLIEEIARTHGLDRLPVAETIHIRAVAPRPADQALGAIRDVLVGLGFHETVTHTLVGRDAASPFLREGRSLLEVDDDRAAAEPSLRSSLLPSLLRVSGHNHDLGTDIVRLFETGSTFDRNADVHHETRRLGLVLDPPAGVDARDPLAAGQAAFGVLRTTVDRIAARLGVDSVVVRPIDAPGFDSAGEVVFDGRTIGVAGLLAAAVASGYGHEGPVAGADLDLGPEGVGPLLESWPPDSAAVALPAYPSIDRDLTVLVDEATPWSEIERAIQAPRTETLDLLEAVEFVTVFRGGRTPAGRKALTLRLRFRATDRTLRHQEVDPGVDTVTEALEGIGGEIPR
ncbi:MAG: phenylalanine--tRNA ligase subunit beta [Planctomycetota bacterium]|nr:phenylalanine--tRNA ligase subunit beta [Planctomycetota bacterium]